MTHKLLVASVVCPAFNKKPSVRAVRDILTCHGFDTYHIVDEAWFGWASKLLALIDTVRKVAEEGIYTHLMFIDGADIVLLDGPDEVMSRYYKLNHPWVYAAEPHIWSINSFTPEQYPTPDCVYRYINAGASVGYIPHMLHWVNVWTKDGLRPPTHLPAGDQDYLAARFIESYSDAMQLDHNCELFQCMCGSLVGDDPRCTMSSGYVRNNTTGSEPIVIHFNGGDDIMSPDRSYLWQAFLEGE